MLRAMIVTMAFCLAGNMMAEVSCWGIAWKAHGQSEIKADGQTLTMTTQNPNSGMVGQISVKPGLRYAVSCEVRGSGKAKLGICGSTGWNFSFTTQKRIKIA